MARHLLSAAAPRSAYAKGKSSSSRAYKKYTDGNAADDGDELRSDVLEDEEGRWMVCGVCECELGGACRLSEREDRASLIAGITSVSMADLTRPLTS